MTDSARSDSSIRCDGVYQVLGSSYNMYLRFFEDGEVISVSSPDSPSEIESWFNREKIAGTPFVSEAGALSFATVGAVTIEYSGTIGGDELHLESQSSNGRRSTLHYVFVPFGEDSIPDANAVASEPVIEPLLVDTMSDDDLLDLFKEGIIPVPYFGDQPVSIEILDDLDTSDLLPALRNFLSLTVEDRSTDGRHLLAYCKMMVDAVGPEVLDGMGGELPTVETIWNFAKPEFLSFSAVDADEYSERRTVYAVLQGAVEWEPEHGLQMCWADGNNLVKVSEFDGHLTNGRASADPEKDAFVFACYRPELCTTSDR